MPKINEIHDTTVASGTIVSFGGTVAPAGWALCDGSQVSRSVFSTLFSKIGVSWGEGDGSTTFHLPDLRGRFLRGRDAAAGRDPDAGARTASNAGGNTGDNVGSVQDDALQNITGEFGLSGAAGVMASGQGNGVFKDGTARANWVFGGAGGSRNVAFDASGSPGAKTSTESRSKNANVNYIIKV